MSARIDQRILRLELAELADDIEDEGAVGDPSVRNRLRRLLAAVRELDARHALDHRGRCAVCRRRRGPCPVQELLREYAGDWLAEDPARSAP